MQRDDYMTVRQIAELLGVARQTVYSWISRGTAPASHKVGGQVRFLTRDVHAWCIERGIPLPDPGNGGRPGA